MAMEQPELTQSKHGLPALDTTPWDTLDMSSRKEVLDRAAAIHADLGEIIRASDSKAAPILGATGVALGLLTNITLAQSKGSQLVPSQLIALACIIAFLTGAFICACGSFLPRMRGSSGRWWSPKWMSDAPIDNEQTTVLYFGHINGFPTAEAYANALIETADRDARYFMQLVQQIRVLSVIAQRKFVLLTWSVRCMVAAVIVAAFSFLTIR